MSKKPKVPEVVTRHFSAAFAQDVAESSREALQRLQVVAEQREAGRDPWDPPRFVPTHRSQALLDLMPPPEDEAGCEAMKEAAFRVAGRMVSKRRQGKVGFFHLLDDDGRIQAHIRKDVVGEENYELFKAAYVGDWVGVQGWLERTKTGETTVFVREIVPLSKALRPLPEKHKGLQDQEARYRRRYLDLISNDQVRETFRKRSLMMRTVRRFLDDRGFLEVENPTLHTLAGGAEARPFVTHHNQLGQELYLRIAHELHLKRLLVGGFERVYELGKVFRNEGVSPKHNPEFTLLEAYWAHADSSDWMDASQALLRELAVVARGEACFQYKGRTLDLGKPWRRLSYEEGLKQHGGIDFSMLKTREDALETARSKGVGVDPAASHGKIIDTLFSHFVEESLWEPTFVYDYPLPLSPLARRKAGDPFVTQRFEGFVAHMEVCNAFTELIDPVDQRERFEDQAKAREAGDDEAHQVDEDFLLALEHGMPPAGGIGYGLDRLFMILLDADSIRDVVLFPHMRPAEGRDAGEDEA